jgi:hypothetical protein
LNELEDHEYTTMGIIGLEYMRDYETMEPYLSHLIEL